MKQPLTCRSPRPGHASPHRKPEPRRPPASRPPPPHGTPSLTEATATLGRLAGTEPHSCGAGRATVPSEEFCANLQPGQGRWVAPRFPSPVPLVSVLDLPPVSLPTLRRAQKPATR